MKKNSILTKLDEIFAKEGKNEYLNFIIFLLSFANLQTIYNDENPSMFFKDIIENFNSKIDDLPPSKELYTILSMIENYDSIPRNYKIKTKLFEESKSFYERKLQNIIKKTPIYLTRFQKELFDDCIDKNNYIFGMPTSFGKSFVIRLVALYRANENKRTIICVPTLALLNEYRIEFNKINDLNVEISSNPLFNKNFKILITTQERLINFEIMKDDLLIIDEAYLIDDENLRGAILKSLTKQFLIKNNSVKFFQPNIIRIDNESFAIKNKFKIKIINYSFCTQKEMEIKKKTKVIQNVVDIVKKSYKNKEKIGIFALKSKHIKYAVEISKKINIFENFENEEWFKMLEEIYTNNYLPIHFLSRGILINNGDLPKFFRFISENVFKNNKNMFILICNNTLTKGINFSLKNIIIQSKNGIDEKTNINEFELKNLIGRIGRYSSNNINDRLGKFYIVLWNDDVIKNIKKIKEQNKIEYKPEKEEKESEKYKKWLENINNGTFEPWKYILENFNGDESSFKKFIIDNFKCITNYYKTKNNKDEYYNFIIELFGGKDKYIQKFFFRESKNYEKEKSVKQENYLIWKTKNRIFKHVFENVPISNLVKEELSYFKGENYFFDPKKGIVSKEKSKNDWKKISDIKIGDNNYKLIFTSIMNKLSNEINSFYSGNFALIEPKIIEIIKEKDPNFNPESEYSKLDIIMDKYNLPRDFREYLIKKNIKNEDDLEASKEFQIIKKILLNKGE